MTDDNLVEFLGERVLATRQLHHIKYPMDNPDAPVAVAIDSIDDGLMIVILPTLAEGVLHLEQHYFVDGERIDPLLTIPTETNGCTEHTLRRPDAFA
jgi:hypothetical protein